MTVSEMIEMLEQMDGNAEVRLAFQPQWPFEHEVGEIVEVEYGDDDDEVDDDADRPNIVYIGEGGQLDYLPGNASSALGWR